MRIEHCAFQVSDPVAMAEWYVDVLGFQVRRSLEEPPHTRFLADSGGGVMLEFYHNPAVPVPNYWSQDPFLVHVALVSDNVEADRQRLIEAGATAVSGVDQLPNGDVMTMLRDPWGFPVQLAQRGESMLADG